MVIWQFPEPVDGKQNSASSWLLRPFILAAFSFPFKVGSPILQHIYTSPAATTTVSEV
ncbi:hypothetical protein LINPERHAP1_LOCUS7082 [Linum perenne]